MVSVFEQKLWLSIDLDKVLMAWHGTCNTFCCIDNTWNLCIATSFNKLSAIEQKLLLCIGFNWSLGNRIGSHIGDHFEFTHLDMAEVILMCLDELLILENPYFDITFIKLSDVEQKL